MRLEDCRKNEFVDDLRSAYKLAEKDAGRFIQYTTKTILSERAVLKPAKSFYVTFEEACRMINAIEKNGICGKSGLNAQKFNDLHREFLRLRMENPDVQPLAIIQMAIELPAPRFYIKAQTARLILNKNIK